MAAPAGVNEGLPSEPVVCGSGDAAVAAADEMAEPVVESAGVASSGEPGLTQDPPQEAGAVAEPEPGEAGWEDRKRRDLSALAVAGIALAIVAMVAVAVGVLAVITHGFRPKTVITYRPAAVYSLRPGDCLNSGPDGLAVTRLSCATPHDAEVFATFALPAGAWPGQVAAHQEAGSGCASRLSGYLNPQLAGAALAQEFVYPDRASWQAGERTVVCEVRASTGQLTGSVRG